MSDSYSTAGLYVWLKAAAVVKSNNEVIVKNLLAELMAFRTMNVRPFVEKFQDHRLDQSLAEQKYFS